MEKQIPDTVGWIGPKGLGTVACLDWAMATMACTGQRQVAHAHAWSPRTERARWYGYQQRVCGCGVTGLAPREQGGYGECDRQGFMDGDALVACDGGDSLARRRCVTAMCVIVFD
jgi:2-polyprenyl-6-methoxyphenol hydroxylase-like FAD-dependent oxidoreductase